MSTSDDFVRYVEYLQRQILSEGWEEAFDLARLRFWASNNLDRLAAITENYPLPYTSSPVQSLEQVVSRFAAETRYELPLTRSIFEPLLNDIRGTADRLGIGPIASVHIATSTNATASPFARPVEGQHLLFIGLGTSSFCNYWAKAYSTIVKSIPEDVRIDSPDEISRVFSSNPNVLVLPTRLALYYGFFGTTMGFGEVSQPPEYLTYRLQLLNAMEVFAVAHEYAHFVAEERLPRFRGRLTPTVANELETFCDALGLQLSRNYGDHTDNFLAFVGVGALIFFRAMELSEAIRAILQSSRLRPDQAQVSAQEPLHPPYEDRIATIRQLLERTAPDQREHVISFFEEYNRITIGTNTVVRGIIEDIANQR